MELKLKYDPSNKPIEVEVKTKTTKGTAKIKFFPGKDNTIIVSKPSKQEFKVAKILARDVIKKI